MQPSCANCSLVNEGSEVLQRQEVRGSDRRRIFLHAVSKVRPDELVGREESPAVEVEGKSKMLEINETPCDQS